MYHTRLSFLGIIALLLFASLLALSPSAYASDFFAHLFEDGPKDTPTPFPPPVGPDLDVLYIQRRPLYSAYCVEYPGGIPQLCPGTENEQRWPNPGEEITFTAHIANKGNQPSTAVEYAWLVDSTSVYNGILPALAPGEQTTVEYMWSWEHDIDGEHALGEHSISIYVDPEDTLAENFESNNQLLDDTLAMSFRIVITPEMLAAYNTPVDPQWPWSAEDWLQKQIAMMNTNFKRAIYPTTPQGATQRVRIDTIEVSSTAPEIDRQFDGGWYIDTDLRHGASAWYDPETDIDWALIHELSHQVGMIDLYMSDIPYDNVQVQDQDGFPVNFGFSWPNADLMGGGSILPYTDGNMYSSHSAAGVSTQRGYRNGYYGVYQFDIPMNNTLLILDRVGHPAAGVEVTLYQRNGPNNWLWQPVIDPEPEITGTTDQDGLLLLPNRSANGGTTTRTNHVLKDNPFGIVDIIHTQNRFLGRLSNAEHEEYFWLDITDFNLAYWSGDTLAHTYTIPSHIPLAGAPLPPEIITQRVEANRVTLCWEPSPTQGVIGYNVYRAERPIYTYEKVTSTPVSGACHEDIHIDDSYTFGGYVYTVTAVKQGGLESGFSNFAWAGNLVSPIAVLVRPNNTRLVLVPSIGYALLEQDQAGRYRRYFGFPDYQLPYAQHIGQDANSNLLLSHSGDWYGDRQSVKVIAPDGAPILEFGQAGSGPGEFSVAAGVAAWGEPCSVEGPYTVDNQTTLLLHFDGSILGAEGEAGDSEGIEFVPGLYDQALNFDDEDLLTYAIPGNIDPDQGAIEFWVKPGWNGNDEESYTFFEAGEEWFNRLRIMKDGGNNLRFMVWDADTEYGIAYNVASWVAGEWHHVGATWEDDQIALFVDGQQVGSEHANLPGEIPGMIYIGSSLWHDQQAEAVMDELRVSSTARLGNSEVCNKIIAADLGNHRIQAFDSFGRYITQIGSDINQPGYLERPNAIAVDHQGRVLVTDVGAGKINLYQFDGQQFTYLTSYPGFGLPNGITVDSEDNIYVADTSNNRVVVLDRNGNHLLDLTYPNDGYNGTLDKPYSVAVDAEGTIIVADTGNHRVITISVQIPCRRYLPVIKTSP